MMNTPYANVVNVLSLKCVVENFLSSTYYACSYVNPMVVLSKMRR